MGGGKADITFLGELLQCVRADHPFKIFVSFHIGMVALIGNIAVIGPETSLAILANKPYNTPYAAIPRDRMGSAVRTKQVSNISFLLLGNRLTGNRQLERGSLYTLHGVVQQNNCRNAKEGGIKCMKCSLDSQLLRIMKAQCLGGRIQLEDNPHQTMDLRLQEHEKLHGYIQLCQW